MQETSPEAIMRIAAAQTAYVAAAPISGAPGSPARPASTRFSLSTGGTDTTGSTRSAAPLATLDAILALQGDDQREGQERRRRAARRGQELLDALDGLKVALLSGETSAAALGRITNTLAASAMPSGDPRLDHVVAEIELRAAVELAKLASRAG